MTFAFLIAVTNGQKKCQHRRTTKVYHDIKTINNNIIIFKDDFPTISLEKITLEDGLSIAEILCQNVEPYPELADKLNLKDISATLGEGVSFMSSIYKTHPQATDGGTYAGDAGGGGD